MLYSPVLSTFFFLIYSLPGALIQCHGFKYHPYHPMTLKCTPPALTSSLSSIEAGVASSSMFPLRYRRVFQTSVSHKILHLPHPQSCSSQYFPTKVNGTTIHPSVQAKILKAIFHFFSATHIQSSASYVISIFKIDLLTTFTAIYLFEPLAGLLY